MSSGSPRQDLDLFTRLGDAYHFDDMVFERIGDAERLRQRFGLEDD